MASGVLPAAFGWRGLRFAPPIWRRQLGCRRTCADGDRSGRRGGAGLFDLASDMHRTIYTVPFALRGDIARSWELRGESISGASPG